MHERFRWATDYRGHVNTGAGGLTSGELSPSSHDSVQTKGHAALGVPGCGFYLHSLLQSGLALVESHHSPWSPSFLTCRMRQRL